MEAQRGPAQGHTAQIHERPPSLPLAPSAEVNVALMLFGNTTLGLEKYFVLCDPPCSSVIIPHQSMT